MTATQGPVNLAHPRLLSHRLPRSEAQAGASGQPPWGLTRLQARANCTHLSSEAPGPPLPSPRGVCEERVSISQALSARGRSQPQESPQLRDPRFRRPCTMHHVPPRPAGLPLSGSRSPPPRPLFQGSPGRASVVESETVKNLPAMLETWVQSLGQEDPLEKETAIHFSILAWRIRWTEEPGGPQSMGSQKVGHN